MIVSELQSHPVFTALAGQPLAQAARQMLELNVGALVVVGDDGARRPVGMLTDRDIVCGQLNRRSDLHCLTVGDVMTSPAVCVGDQQGAEEAIALLRARAVRRAPVVDRAGDVVGIIAVDDLLPAVAAELQALAHLAALSRR